MGKTTTLQASLNDIADDKLDRDIEHVKGAIVKHLYTGWGRTPVTMKAGNESVTVHLTDVVDGIATMLRKTLEERRRAEETQAFMNKVDSLGNEIDALRDEVGLS